MLTYDKNIEHENVFDIYVVREDGEYDPKVAEVYSEDMAKLVVNTLNMLEHNRLVEALKVAKGAVEWMAGATDSDPEDHERLELVNKAIDDARTIAFVNNSRSERRK